ASCDPIESPSGRAWEEIRNRRRAWIASQISVFGVGVVIRGRGLVGSGRRPGVRLGLDFLEGLLDAVVLGDRLVVGEFELGHPPEADALRDLAAQERRGAVERLAGFLVRL